MDPELLQKGSPEMLFFFRFSLHSALNAASADFIERHFDCFLFFIAQKYMLAMGSQTELIINHAFVSFDSIFKHIFAVGTCL